MSISALWFNTPLFWFLLDLTWKVWLGSGVVLVICWLAILATFAWGRS